MPVEGEDDLDELRVRNADDYDRIAADGEWPEFVARYESAFEQLFLGASRVCDRPPIEWGDLGGHSIQSPTTSVHLLEVLEIESRRSDCSEAELLRIVESMLTFGGDLREFPSLIEELIGVLWVSAPCGILDTARLERLSEPSLRSLEGALRRFDRAWLPVAKSIQPDAVMVMMNVDPFPRPSDSATTVPPCCCTMPFVMKSPIPEPCPACNSFTLN